MSSTATEVMAAAQAEIERLTEEADGLVATILEAVDMAEQVRDLLLERIQGSPARSAAHNARVRADSLIALLTAKTGRRS
jgi:hypothetical protein